MQGQIEAKDKILTDERSSSVISLRVYSESFKIKVVKELISGKFPSKESAREFYENKSIFL